MSNLSILSIYTQYLTLHHHHSSLIDRMKEKSNMKSNLEGNELDDFLESAEMEGNDFEVARVHQNHAFLVQATTHRSIQTLDFSEFTANHLSIPRKPAWTREMTAEEVDRNEKHAFLKWRREIATLESNDNYSQKVTPFEKNIEVWRQLWRVCERSDLIIQIVDARNPLLYYTKDLKSYVAEMSPPRMMVLLINKSDFLTDYQRMVWAEHLTSLGIHFCFYSAFVEQAILDAMDYSTEEVSDEVGAAAKEDIAMLAASLVDNFLDMAPTLTEKGKRGASAVASSRSSVVNTSGAGDTSVGPAIVDVVGESRLPSGPVKDDHGIKCSANDADQVEAELYDDKEEEEKEKKVEVKLVNNDDDVGDDGEEDDGDEEEEEAKSEEVEDDFSDDEDDNDDTYLAQLARGIETRQRDDNRDDEDDDEEEGDDDFPTGQISSNITSTSNRLASSVTQSSCLTMEQRRTRILSRSELLYLLISITSLLKVTPQSRHGGRVCVGLVGYPNVGKSSVINTLLGVSKSSHGRVRVGVSSTPGKTKHFQTLFLSDTLMLCDCPGLVFPSFMRSAGDMLCAGILPINQMRDYLEPASVIASRVPQYLLEATLGITIYRHLDPLDKSDRPPTPSEMLGAYCQSRGYITNGTGRWDEFRACKDMLKLYTDGVILNVAIPPVATEILLVWIKETEKIMMRNLRVAERLGEQQVKSNLQSKSLAALMKECEVSTGGMMVFGDNQFENGSSSIQRVDDGTPTTDSIRPVTRVDVNGYEFVEDSDDEDDDIDQSTMVGSIRSSAQGALTSTTARREHKRLPHWGKKNRKLRNKNPYGEDTGPTSFIMYSRNRSSSGIPKDARSADGTPFVRSILPHHLLTSKV